MIDDHFKAMVERRAREPVANEFHDTCAKRRERRGGRRLKYDPITHELILTPNQIKEREWQLALSLADGKAWQAERIMGTRLWLVARDGALAIRPETRGSNSFRKKI